MALPLPLALALPLALPLAGCYFAVMSVHVAVVQRPYDRLILGRTKRIESRFTKIDCPPFGCVRPGERIYFKRSGGPFFAVAEAACVLMVDRLTPAKVDELVARYNRWICGEAGFWRVKRKQVRYATLIWLRGVRPHDRGPAYRRQNMRAWYTLDAAADPLGDQVLPEGFEVTLSAGGVRQNYVRVPAEVADEYDGRPLTIELGDGRRIETDIVRGMFRWRGWGGWFQSHGLGAGDRVAFEPTGDHAFVALPQTASEADADPSDADQPE